MKMAYDPFITLSLLKISYAVITHFHKLSQTYLIFQSAYMINSNKLCVETLPNVTIILKVEADIYQKERNLEAFSV